MTKNSKKVGKNVSKKQPKKGELDLDDLRKNKEINKIVEKQLRYLLKGKQIPISKYKSKKTQCKVTSNFSSQSSSESSSDSNLSVESISVKKEKKKRKMRKSLPASDSSSSCSSMSFKISKRKSLKKGKSKKYVLSESDSELTSSVSDSDTDSSSSVDEKKIKKIKKSNNKKSGMVAMATDHVVNPQIWPQTNLQYEYVSKGVTFQQLDFKLFVARELEIISSKNIGDKEKKARVALLKKIVDYSSVYHWKALLEFYAAFVRQIESGQRSWGDSSVDLEVPILSKHVKQDFNKSNNTFKKDNNYPTVWYCFLYQKNKCSMNSPHSVMIRCKQRSSTFLCYLL